MSAPSASSSNASQLSSTDTTDAKTSPDTAPPAAAPNKDASVLDLVFLVDCTGSMGSYIHSAQQNMHRIVETIVAAEKADVQVAVVGYRDFCDDWVTKVFEFERGMSKIKTNIDNLCASGGGDAPEAITAGLFEVNKLSYRKNSTRVAVLIADAPDHGLGESGDQHPQGDPQGRDPLKIAREMAAQGIVLYTVACEPSLSQSQYGRDFFMMLAKITQGQFLPLTSATLLADVIIGGAKEEISLQKIQDAVEQEAERVRQEKALARGVKADAITDEEIAPEVADRMKACGFTVNQVAVDDVYGGSYNMANVDVFMNVGSLADARKALKPGLNAAMGSSAPFGGYGAAGAAGYGAAPSYGAMPMPMASACDACDDDMLSFSNIAAPPAPAAAAAASYASLDLLTGGAPAPPPMVMGSHAAMPTPMPMSSMPMMPMAMPAVQNAYTTTSWASTEQIQRVMKKVSRK